MDLFQKIEWFEKMATDAGSDEEEISFDGENFSDQSVLERKNAAMVRMQKLAAFLKG